MSGQVLWKEATGGSWLQSFFSPLFWIGLFLYGVALLIWLNVLHRLPLSRAYPMQAMAYVLGVAASRVILHETIPFTRWVGVAVILLGVTLVGV